MDRCCCVDELEHKGALGPPLLQAGTRWVTGSVAAQELQSGTPGELACRDALFARSQPKEQRPKNTHEDEEVMGSWGQPTEACAMMG